MGQLLIMSDISMLDKHYLSNAKNNITVYNSNLNVASYKSKDEIEKLNSSSTHYDLGTHVLYLVCKPGEVIKIDYPICAYGIVTNGSIECPAIQAGVVYAENIRVDGMLDAPCIIAKKGISAGSIITNDIAAGKFGIRTNSIDAADKKMPFRVVSEGDIVCETLMPAHKTSTFYCLGDVRAKNIKIKELLVKGDVTSETLSLGRIVLGGKASAITGTIANGHTNLPNAIQIENASQETLSLKQGDTQNIFSETSLQRRRESIVQTFEDAIVEPEELYTRMKRDARTTDMFGRAL